MTNQTIILSAQGVDATSAIADVTGLVNHFTITSRQAGYTHLCINNDAPIILNGRTGPVHIYTVQVNYYDPSVGA